MKNIFACVLVCSLCAVPSVSMGQRGIIGLYSDASATGCSADDSSPGYFMVYVVIDHLPEMSGALFQVVPSADFTPSYVAEVSPLPFVGIFGNSQTGLDISFADCLVSPQHVLTITYQRFGTSPPCSYLKIGPNPNHAYTRPIVTGCLDGDDIPRFEPTPLRLYMNPDGSCPCSLPVPVERTNWGRIKGLYR